MKSFLVDTNFILRYLLADDKDLFEKAKKILDEAAKKKIKVEIIPEVIFELNYVLKGVYKVKREKVAEILLNLVKTPYLVIENQSLLIEVLETYQKVNVDLFDIYLYFLGKSKNKEILSFDSDFKKLSHLSPTKFLKEPSYS